MDKKPRSKRVPPMTYLYVGLIVTALSLLTRGTFCPFTLLGLGLLSVFDILFRRCKPSVASLLSLACACAVVFGLARFVINILVMKSDAWDPEIPKNARVFYRPAMFKLAPGDLVVFKLPSDRKKYVGRIEQLAGREVWEVHRPDRPEPARVPRRLIKGKVIFVARPRKSSGRRKPKPQSPAGQDEETRGTVGERLRAEPARGFLRAA